MWRDANRDRSMQETDHWAVLTTASLRAAFERLRPGRSDGEYDMHMKVHIRQLALVFLGVTFLLRSGVRAEEPTHLPKAYVDGDGPGWQQLGESDFENVNCDADTWSWTDGVAHCTGQPIGVIRSQKEYTNFELVTEWQHRRAGGNSGIFIWAPASSVKELQPGGLPHGIEVQVLDHGAKEKYEKQTKKKSDWFTTNGDVFQVGTSRITPFAPVSPDGSRSFPRKELSHGFGKWNHYYIRAINGEVRLWVDGEEVSGGPTSSRALGYLCLESEGSPVEFRNLRIRELP